MVYDLPGTISARWWVPWTSVVPSALKGVGRNAAETLPLTSAVGSHGFYLL